MDKPMKNKIIGTYKITYDNGMIQFKDLISHDDYLNIIIPKQELINELSRSKKGRKQAKEIKDSIIQKFGDNWFTDKSPLFMAHKTGIMELPKHQGGKHKIKIEAV